MVLHPVQVAAAQQVQHSAAHAMAGLLLQLFRRCRPLSTCQAETSYLLAACLLHLLPCGPDGEPSVLHPDKLVASVCIFQAGL